MFKIIFVPIQRIIIALSMMVLVFNQPFSRANSSEQQSYADYIYSPFEIKEYVFAQAETTPLDIKIAKVANLMFVAGGKGGIVIINLSSQEIVLQHITNSDVLSLGVSQDGQYLFINQDTNIYSLFYDSKSNQLISLSSAEYSKDGDSVLDFLINDDESIMYAVGLNGLIRAFDITNKHSIKRIGQLSTESNGIYKSKVLQQKKGNQTIDWLFLSDDLNGLSVVRCERKNENEIALLLVGRGGVTFKSRDVVITQDMKYVFVADNWNGIFIADLSQFYTEVELKLSNDTSQFKEVDLKLNQYWFSDEINPSLYSLMLVYSLQLSENSHKYEKYLIAGVRSKGMYIFDITDRLNPILFQQIPSIGHAIAVGLNLDQSQIYFSNSISIKVYRRSKSNFNTTAPNLFNKHQIQDFQLSQSFYKWRCYIEQINNKFYYFGAFDSSGIYISEIQGVEPNQNLDLVQHLTFDDGQMKPLINSLQIFRDDQRILMYVPVQINDEMIRIYDITSPQSLQFISSLKTLKGDDAQYGENLFISQDGNYILMTQDKGIVFIDSSNKINLEILCEWKESESTNGEYSSVVITLNNKWIIGTIRGYGVYVIDAAKQSSLKQVSKLQTLGGECIILSKYDNNYAYLSDGFLGIAIIDLNALPDIIILSRIQLNGWSNFIALVPSLMNNQQVENYLIVAQLESGMLSVIDIQDKENMKIINQFQVRSQSAQSLCLLNNQNIIETNNKLVTYENFKSIFINNNQAVYQLPLTTQVLIHSEIMKVIINEEGKASYDTIKSDNENDIYIGETVLLSLIPIYPKSGMKITSIQYLTLDYNSPQSLPSWIEYNPNQNSILIQVDKEALGKDHEEGFQNILLIQLQSPLKQEDFLYTTSQQLNNNNNEDVTSQEESLLIYNYLIKEGYLNQKGDITMEYTFDTIFYFKLKTRQTYSKALCERVKKTFLNSIFINPIYINASSSLIFKLRDLKKENIQQHKHILTKSTKNIKFMITIPEEIGRFVDVPYNGVITSTNTNQNQFILEGSLDNINIILFNKLLYFSELNIEMNPVSTSQIKIEINDYVNYPLSLQLPFLDSSKSYLNVQPQIVISDNPDNSLQHQFNKKYSGSIIDIVSSFSISFQSDAFKYPPGFPQLQFKTKYNINGGEFQEFSGSDFWLQQSLNTYEMRFYGTPPSSQYKNNICIRVTTSNQYSQSSDTFCMKIQGLPAIYILNKIVTFLGPILGILGFWKYKGSLFNLFFRKKVTYSDEIAYCGQVYQKKVPILSLDAQKALYLFQKLMYLYEQDFKNSNNLPECLKGPIQFNRQSTQELENEDVKKDKKEMVQSYMKSQQLRRLKPYSGVSLEENLSTNCIRKSSSGLESNYNVQGNNSQQIEQQKQNKQIYIQKFETFQELQVEELVCDIKDDNQTNRNDKIQQQIINNDQVLTKNKVVRNKSQMRREMLEDMKKKTIQLIFHVPAKKEKFSQSLEQNYLRSDGRIKMSQIVSEILNRKLSIQIMAEDFHSHKMRTDLTNRHSSLFTCLKCIAARYFLSLDPRSKSVYNYIKQYCFTNFDVSSNDWYLSIVNIDPNVTELDQNGNIIPFPKLSVKEDILNTILIDLQIHNQLGQTFHSISICDVNPYLIEQVLFADVLGILGEIPSFLYPSVGESLHLERYDILKILAFKKIESSYCMKLRKIFNMDYLPFGLSKNNELPNWLTLQISQNTIIFEGIPQSQDIYDDILIRILHRDGYIIRQFHLKVSDEFNPKYSDNEQIPDTFENEDDQRNLLRQTTLILPKLVNKRSKSLLIQSTSTPKKSINILTQNRVSQQQNSSPKESSFFLFQRGNSAINMSQRESKEISSLSFQSYLEQIELQDNSLQSPTLSIQSPNNFSFKTDSKNIEENIVSLLAQKQKFNKNLKRAYNLSQDEIEELSSKESDHES